MASSELASSLPDRPLTILVRPEATRRAAAPTASPRVSPSASATRGDGREERRRRILGAALRLFATLPYADVHVDAIAAAARVAKPTLYRYVATKEALFIEALAFMLAELRTEIAPEIASEPTLDPASGLGPVVGPALVGRGIPEAETRLGRAVAAMLDRVGALGPAIHAVEGRGSEFGERSRRVLREGFSGLRDCLARLLADGVRAGAFAPDLDVDLAVVMILGTVRMAAGASVNGLGTGARASADALADLLLGGLRAPAAPPQGASREAPRGAPFPARLGAPAEAPLPAASSRPARLGAAS